MKKLEEMVDLIGILGESKEGKTVISYTIVMDHGSGDFQENLVVSNNGSQAGVLLTVRV